MGIKNSTAPIPVEITESEVVEFQSSSQETNTTPTPFLFQNGDSPSNGASEPEPTVQSNKEISNLHTIVKTFGKMRQVSTLVLKDGIPDNRDNGDKQQLFYEIYETLNEEALLYRAEQRIRNWNICCLTWTVHPILIYDNCTGNEIAQLSFLTRVIEGNRIEVIEISSQNIILGYIQKLATKSQSHEIMDEKYAKIFSVERKILGFRCIEYQVRTVSTIEVSACVAIVRTPREGKVFTEMHSSLSASFKALLMSFSLYLLTLPE